MRHPSTAQPGSQKKNGPDLRLTRRLKGHRPRKPPLMVFSPIPLSSSNLFSCDHSTTVLIFDQIENYIDHMKIVQIATIPESSNINPLIFALCDDGSLWSSKVDDVLQWERDETPKLSREEDDENFMREKS